MITLLLTLLSGMLSRNTLVKQLGFIAKIFCLWGAFKGSWMEATQVVVVVVENQSMYYKLIQSQPT